MELGFGPVGGAPTAITQLDDTRGADHAIFATTGRAQRDDGPAFGAVPDEPIPAEGDLRVHLAGHVMEDRRQHTVEVRAPRIGEVAV